MPTTRPRRSPGIVCRRDVPASSTDGNDYLVGLVRQVAAGDRAAFADLHTVRSPALVAVARSRMPAAADADAVVVATFVEMWWMARFHTAAGTDVCAWTNDIVRRRAAERTGGTEVADRQMQITLAVLLGP